MDIFKELRELPYFAYYINEKLSLLGGQNIPHERFFSLSMIRSTWERMIDIYNRNELSEMDKEYLAICVKKMRNQCEGAKISTEDLKLFIDQLTIEQRKELEKQIQMYKDARNYYKAYAIN